MKLTFTEPAAKAIARLPSQTAKRIVKKMQWFAVQEDPLSFAKPLADKRLGDYRFRIGAYRVLVDVKKDRISVLVVLAVRHRKDAYGV